MKKLLGLILVVVAFTSCSAVYDLQNITQDNYNKKVLKTTLYISDKFDSIKTKDDIISFIHNNIKYKASNDENVQSPEATMKLRTGDCKALSVLYMNILYVKFGEKSELCGVDHNDASRSTNMTSNKQIVVGGYIDHAIVKLNDGRVIDIQTGNIFTGPIKFIYSFDEIFQ